MINEIFVPVGILLTFIASIFTIYYSRKNLRISKYIDTITTSRIKWLEVLRKEITELTSNIYFTIKIYREVIEERKEEAQGYDPADPNYNPYEYYFDARTKDALVKKRTFWSESDFVEKLNLIKLRLNAKEDLKIIETLDYFLKFYKDSQFKSENDIILAEQKVNQLIKDTQSLLKIEWEKCKKETKNK